MYDTIALPSKRTLVYHSSVFIDHNEYLIYMTIIIQYWSN